MAYEYNVPSIDFTNQESVENVDVDEFFFGKMENLKIEESPEGENELDQNVKGAPVEADLCEAKHNEIDEKEKNLENLKLQIKESPDIESGSVLDVDLIPDYDRSDEDQNDKNKKRQIRQVLRERNIRSEESGKERKNISPMPDNRIKYVSLAEGVNRYPQQLTKCYLKKKANNCHVTVPQSPLPPAKTQHRPVNYRRAEECEKQLFQEIDSYKSQVNPVNKIIFKTPKLGAHVLPKKDTVVQPFMLTEFKNKDPVPKNQKSPYIFKASKISEGALTPPVGIPDTALIPCAKPQTPPFLRNENYKRQIQVLEEVDGKNVYVTKDLLSIGVKKCETRLLPRTEVKPFSFEDRDKHLKQQKEEKLRKIIEEEKKAREFHAQPLPAYLKSKINSLCPPTRSGASNSSIKSAEDPETFQFKARPAGIVHKKSCFPKRPGSKPLEPLPVELQTEMRAMEREKFDDKLNKELEKREQYLQERKEEQMRKKEEDIV